VAAVTLENVSKHFGSVTALDRVSLEIESGEFVTVLGPSGCGKSTLLRLVAGLDAPTTGEVRIGTRRLETLAVRDRRISMVFQRPMLYPHKTVRSSVEFPLLARKVPRVERRSRAEAMARVLGVADVLERRGASLSEGQCQRVALARALVSEPAVVLLDEPLSAVDASTRDEIREELLTLHGRLGITILYVTHDHLEAMAMGSRVAVMSPGRVEQIATPREIYAAPASVGVARSLGSPGMNILTPGRLDDTRDLIGLRPEHLRLDLEGLLPVVVSRVEYRGHESLILAMTPWGDEITVRSHAGIEVSPGDPCRLSWDVEDVHRFDSVTGERLAQHRPFGPAL
jgi:ABC-type sugar transport system ATPase subunit